MWQPPVEPSRLEQAVMQRIKRARLFVWLRQHRHELVDEGFQAELATMYDQRPLGQPPVPPVLLALATVLQAYTGCSDDEVLEACVMDRRWQLVLDCMDHAQPPFSKGTLVAFRGRLIAAELDRRLLERTVELYQQQAGRPAVGRLRAALDASPLWGAGGGHDQPCGSRPGSGAGRAWRPAGWGLAAAERARLLAGQAGIPVLAGSSVKATLDLDWDATTAGERALAVVLEALARVEQLVGALPGGDDPRVADALAAAFQVRDQDVTIGEDGVARIRHGSHGTDGSRSPTPRCATAARPRACGWTATSGMCCGTWTMS